MKSTKNLTPEAMAQAGQIGELLERTAASTATADTDRAAASKWWREAIANLRKNFQQRED